MKHDDVTFLDLEKNGGTGLSGASRLDREIWPAFQVDGSSIVSECEVLRAERFGRHGHLPVALGKV